MIEAQFPKYQSEQIARNWGCFNCGKPLTDQIKIQDYISGKYVIKCIPCQMYTWFDIGDE